MFLILTEAGKPVYSSSQSSKIPEFCGILATIFEYFLQNDSKLISFTGRTDKFIFLKRNCLIFTIFTQYDEILARHYLKLLSDLLISHFTDYSLRKILKERSNYDLSHSVSGIKVFIESCIGPMQCLFMVQDALSVLKVPRTTRESLKSVFAQVKSKYVSCAILFSNKKVIMTKRQKKASFHPSDLALVLESITVALGQSTDDVEIWMPICLPRFNKNGFLYLYGVFLTRKLGIACLSFEKDGFSHCSVFSREIFQKLSQIKEMESLVASVRADPFNLVEIGIPGLLHFFYKSKEYLQIVIPKNTPPYSYKQDWKRLLSKYHNLSVNFQQKVLNWVFQKGEKESILASQTPKYELYVVVGPLVTLEFAQNVQSRLLLWLKVEHDSLFLISSPIF